MLLDLSHVILNTDVISLSTSDSSSLCPN